MQKKLPQKNKIQATSLYSEKSLLAQCNVLMDSLAKTNLKSIIKNSNKIATSHISIQKGHWANRDFSEYREVA